MAQFFFYNKNHVERIDITLESIDFNCNDWDGTADSSEEINNFKLEYLGCLDLLVIILNKKNHSEFGRAYWEVIVGPWLMLHVYVVRVVREKIRERLVGGVYSVFVGQESIAIPKSKDDYKSMLNSEAFRDYIIINIAANELGGRLVKVRGVISESEAERTLLSRKSGRLIFLHDLHHRMIGFMNMINIYRRKKDAKFIWFSQRRENRYHLLPEINKINNGVYIRGYYKSIEASEVSLEERSFYVRETGIPVLQIIPVCYMESYHDYVDFSKKIISPMRNTVRLIFFDAVYGSDEIQRFVAAFAKENHAIDLVSVQHGGFYGIGKNSSYLWLEKRLCDIRITWGYQYEESDVPLPSLLLEDNIMKFNQRKLRDNPSKRIKFVLHYASSLRLDFDSMPFGCLSQQYNFEVSSIVNNYSKSAKNEFLVRPYPGVSIEQQDINRNGYMLLDGGESVVSFSDSILLYVHFFNSTGFLETLSLDVPTVIYMPEKFFQVNDRFMMYYDLMIDAGIVYNDGEHLVRFLDQIGSDYDLLYAWWESSLVREAVECVVNNYAMTCSDSLCKWNDFISDW